jgi:hypothetical protein
VNETNAPAWVLVPKWGPDMRSRVLAAANALRTNPFSPASWGIGVRPAQPGGSVTEGTKSDSWLPPQQNFRSAVGRIADPSLRTTRPTAQFPGASVAVSPVQLSLGFLE